MVHDVAVSLRHAHGDGRGAAAPLPADGAVFPRWRASSADGPSAGWTAVTYADARKLVPHLNVRDPQGTVRITSLRVFASGAAVVIGRWPGEMADVFETLRTQLRAVRDDVVPASVKRQRTLPGCWAAAQSS